jgi:hypothetical protein
MSLDAPPGPARRARAGQVPLAQSPATEPASGAAGAALDVHPRVAMRILRHAQIDVTMNVYTEVSDAKTLHALKRLGRQLGS